MCRVHLNENGQELDTVVGLERDIKLAVANSVSWHRHVMRRRRVVVSSRMY